MNWLERFWTGCDHCKGEQACPLLEPGVGAESVHASVSSGLLVVRVVLVFLLPLATAIGGSYLASRMWAADTAGSRTAWQVAGMIAGMTIGVAMARLGVRLLGRRQSRTDQGA